MNDKHDIDRGELKLIRVGHALWADFKRERRQNGLDVAESGPTYAALQTMWRLKREYRANLKLERALKSARLRETFKLQR